MASNNVVLLPQLLMLKDLERSGLDDKAARRLKLSALKPEEASTLVAGYRGPAYRIPYLDARGEETSFFRLKILGDLKYFGRERAVKYWQPKDSPPRAYFPPLLKWAELLQTNAPLYLTEGEKKAAKACLHGIPCIGLGGIWSWRSKRQRRLLIQDLDEIAWADRPVRLCFDAEREEKPEIQGALEALGSVLARAGARVELVRLPLLGEQAKTGLDDFLVARGPRAFLELKPEPLVAGADLALLNEELAVIQEPSGLFHLPTKQFFTSPKPLTDILYADKRVPVVDAAGNLRERNAVLEWLQWGSHRRHAALAYEPGQEAELEDGRLNLWRGPSVQPKRGPVTLWRELLNHVFADATREERQWFERWVAYPLRFPGAKLYAAVVLWTRTQGAGKSLVGETIGRLYGEENFSVVGERDLHGAFNYWQQHKQFVLGEEVTGSDRRSEADRLKRFITGETVSIQRKYERPYTVRDCVNYLFTTNHPDAFLIDPEDRRYFVWEVKAGELPPEVWRPYDEWYRTPEAVAALLQWAQEIDLGDFHPKTKAPVTQAKLEMTELSGSEVDGLVRGLRQNPNQYLLVGDVAVARDLFTLRELVELLDPHRRYNLGEQRLSKAFKRAGFDNFVVKSSTGPVRLYPVRNVERWLRASHAERKAGYEGELAPRPKF